MWEKLWQVPGFYKACREGIDGGTGKLKLKNVLIVVDDMEHSWHQKVIRFYDPDGNLIEVGTPMG